MTSALAEGAIPEDADITFSLLNSSNEVVIAIGVFSLRDLVKDRSDASNEVIRMESTESLTGVTLGTGVADISLAVRGWRVATALAGQ